MDGFSLHAAVRVEADDRERLEQLCRFITLPALPDEPVKLNDAGQVELKLETPGACAGPAHARARAAARRAARRSRTSPS
ncbi:MAG: transposase [Burkholderiales bacterium]|nr:transposase [Burkholderiales bacterium]